MKPSWICTDCGALNMGKREACAMCDTPRIELPVAETVNPESSCPPGLAFALCAVVGIFTFLTAFAVNFSNGSPMSPEERQMFSVIGVAGLILGPIIGAAIEVSLRRR